MYVAFDSSQWLESFESVHQDPISEDKCYKWVTESFTQPIRQRSQVGHVSVNLNSLRSFYTIIVLQPLSLIVVNETDLNYHFRSGLKISSYELWFKVESCLETGTLSGAYSLVSITNEILR